MKAFLRNQRGSALISVMIAVLVVGLVAGSVAQFASSSSQQSRADADLRSLMVMVQTLGAIANTNEACMGVAPTLDGLKFKNATTYDQTSFDSTAAGTTAGQQISLGTQLDAAPAPGRFVAKPGAVYTPLALTITDLRFGSVTQIPSTNSFQGNVILTATFNGRTFAPRNIGKLSVTTDGVSTLLSCSFVQSAEIACTNMGCKFNSTATGQKCVCGFPEKNCHQPAGQPQQYISVIDQSTDPVTMQCGGFQVDCSDTSKGGKGPGFFFAGFDSNGDPMCVTVEGDAPGTCTGGASTTVTANAASPFGCYCPAANTWNGSSCVVASSCSGGASTTVTANAASPAGCYCPAAKTWNGVSCVNSIPNVTGTCQASGAYADANAVNSYGLCSTGSASPSLVSGAGPWSWICLGSGSGTNASCSATASGGACTGGATTTVSVVPASPAGCYCTNSQNWTGGTCSTAVTGLCGPILGSGTDGNPTCTALGVRTAMSEGNDNGSGQIPYYWICREVAGTGTQLCHGTLSGCFVAGTLVTMADGTQKPIEKISSGEKVLSYNELNGQTYVETVDQPLHHESASQMLFTFKVANGKSFTATDIHPLFIVEKQTYLTAGEVYKAYVTGQILSLQNIDQSPERILEISVREENLPVYNLHIHGLLNRGDFGLDYGVGHNYFVEGILVHNK